MFSISEDATFVASQTGKHRCCKWVCEHICAITQISARLRRWTEVPCKRVCLQNQTFHHNFLQVVPVCSFSLCSAMQYTPIIPSDDKYKYSMSKTVLRKKKCSKRRGLRQHCDPQGVCAGRWARGCARTAKTFKDDHIVYRLDTEAGWRQGNLRRHRTK